MGKKGLTMLLKASDRKLITIEHLRDGDGYVEKFDCGVSPMPAHATMFAELHLNPNCSIGTHRHEGEYEIFFCKEGEIVLNDKNIKHTCISFQPIGVFFNFVNKL